MISNKAVFIFFEDAPAFPSSTSPPVTEARVVFGGLMTYPAVVAPPPPPPPPPEPEVEVFSGGGPHFTFGPITGKRSSVNIRGKVRGKRREVLAFTASVNPPYRHQIRLVGHVGARRPVVMTFSAHREPALYWSKLIQEDDLILMSL